MDDSEGEVGGDSALNSLVVELDNILAVWRWAAENRDFDEIGKFVNALAWHADDQQTKYFCLEEPDSPGRGCV